jgi:hypothetical protein
MIGANNSPDLHVFWRRSGTKPRVRCSEGKLDVILGAFFRAAPGTRPTPLLRSALMVMRADNDSSLRRTSPPGPLREGRDLIAVGQSRLAIHRQHLASAGVSAHRRAVFKHLDTRIAMVEAGGALPSYFRSFRKDGSSYFFSSGIAIESVRNTGSKRIVAR